MCIYHYECDENRDDYIDCLEKLNMVVENIDSTHITLVGDFNANLFLEVQYLETF